MNNVNNKQTRKNRKRRQTRKTKNANLPPNVSRPNVVIKHNSIMPDIRRNTLHYCDSSTTRNAPGNSFLVYSMRINDLYDPDPAILSGSVSNFKEEMQFYSYYRVLSTSIEWELANNESFPISAGIVFSQVNLVGSIATLGAAQDAFENDYSTPLQLLAAKGGMDRRRFSTDFLQISNLLGDSSQYKSEIGYTGQGLATPSIPLWANFIVFSSNGSSLINGYANITTLHFYAEFFGRVNVRS